MKTAIALIVLVLLAGIAHAQPESTPVTFINKDATISFQDLNLPVKEGSYTKISGNDVQGTRLIINDENVKLNSLIKDFVANTGDELTFLDGGRIKLALNRDNMVTGYDIRTEIPQEILVERPPITICGKEFKQLGKGTEFTIKKDASGCKIESYTLYTFAASSGTAEYACGDLVLKAAGSEVKGLKCNKEGSFECLKDNCFRYSMFGFHNPEIKVGNRIIKLKPSTTGSGIFRRIFGPKEYSTQKIDVAQDQGSVKFTPSAGTTQKFMPPQKFEIGDREISVSEYPVNIKISAGDIVPSQNEVAINPQDDGSIIISQKGAGVGVTLDGIGLRMEPDQKGAISSLTVDNVGKRITASDNTRLLLARGTVTKEILPEGGIRTDENSGQILVSDGKGRELSVVDAWHNRIINDDKYIELYNQQIRNVISLGRTVAESKSISEPKTGAKKEEPSTEQLQGSDRLFQVQDASTSVLLSKEDLGKYEVVINPGTSLSTVAEQEQSIGFDRLFIQEEPPGVVMFLQTELSSQDKNAVNAEGGFLGRAKTVLSSISDFVERYEGVRDEASEIRTIQSQFDKAYSTRHATAGDKEFNSNIDDVIKRVCKNSMFIDCKARMFAIVFQESKFKWDAIDPISPSVGLAQINLAYEPDLDIDMRIQGVEKSVKVAYNPVQNLERANKIFEEKYNIFTDIPKKNDEEHLKFALAAYNAGQGSILGAQNMIEAINRNENEYSGYDPKTGKFIYKRIAQPLFDALFKARLHPNQWEDVARVLHFETGQKNAQITRAYVKKVMIARDYYLKKYGYQGGNP